MQLMLLMQMLLWKKTKSCQAVTKRYRQRWQHKSAALRPVVHGSAAVIEALEIREEEEGFTSSPASKASICQTIHSACLLW